MTRRTKTLIAAILIVFFWLPFYALVTWFIVAPVMAPAPWYVSLAFYPVAGILWIVPIGLALPWMYREPKKAP